MNDSKYQVLNERIDELMAKANNIKAEFDNLKEMGISDITSRLIELDNIDSNSELLHEEIKSKYDSENREEYSKLMNKLTNTLWRLIKSDKEKLQEEEKIKSVLKESVLKKLSVLESERKEYDDTIDEYNNKIAEVNQSLNSGDLKIKLVQSYYEEDLRKTQELISNLKNDRKPLDEEFEKLTQEINIIANGGVTNYYLNEDGNLVEKQNTENDEIKEIEVQKPDNFLERTHETEISNIEDEAEEQKEEIIEDKNSYLNIGGMDLQGPHYENNKKLNGEEMLDIGTETEAEEQSETTDLYSPLEEETNVVFDNLLYKDKELKPEEMNETSVETEIVPMEKIEEKVDDTSKLMVETPTEESDKDLTEELSEGEDFVVLHKEAFPELVSKIPTEEASNYIDKYRIPKEEERSSELNEQSIQLKKGEEATITFDGGSEMTIDAEGNRTTIDVKGNEYKDKVELDNFKIGPEDLVFPDFSVLKEENGPTL